MELFGVVEEVQDDYENVDYGHVPREELLTIIKNNILQQLADTHQGDTH